MSDAITTNALQVLDTLRRTITQIPYATARAVNETAKQVQVAEGENLKAKLVIRSDWWAPRRKFGINIKPFATKEQPSATVGSLADWLKLQEEGGTKRPVTAKNVAAATTEQRGGIAAILRRGMRPRAQLARKDVFVNKDKAGLVGIWKRIGQSIKLLFTLKHTVQIRKVLGFGERGKAVAKANYEDNFKKQYAVAIKDFKK